MPRSALAVPDPGDTEPPENLPAPPRRPLLTLADFPEEGLGVRVYEEAARSFRRRRRPWRRRSVRVAAALALVGGSLVLLEARTSWLQSVVLSRYASEIGYVLEDGPSSSIRFPGPGPYDERLGYAALPRLLPALADSFEVVAQARVTPRFAEAVDRGAFPVYREKTRAGLRVADRDARPIFRALYPDRTIPALERVPAVVVETLLHIENRELLDVRHPRRNPAVEWDRMVRSIAGMGARLLGKTGSVAGASTLATQMEKLRHSPDGITSSPREKVRQMATASLRAYASGPVTVDARRRIAIDYLNSVPLAAIRGYGEVNGLGAGLWAWYRIDATDLPALLGPETPPGREEEAAAAYRAVVSLLIAHRRPSYYLTTPAGRSALEGLTDRHLGLLERDGVAPAALAQAARALRIDLRTVGPPLPPTSFREAKAANAVRRDLLGLLRLDRLYELDRYDLSVRSTMDDEAQRAVSAELLRLRDPAYVAAAGLRASRLLESADPARVVYTFLLYETTPAGNVVRVQTDNFEGPFDPNDDAKLELGSTAKLRTLVTYLEAVQELLGTLGALAPEERSAYVAEHGDPLTRWVADVLRTRPGAGLEDVLEAAMGRRYSANPSERFYTGGGVHTFSNFDDTYDGVSMTVREAFRNSVNLVFIRLMRDVVEYHVLRIPGSAPGILANPGEPRRREYLARFADQEGQTFIRRFHARHRTRTTDESLAILVGGRRLSPLRLARVYRAVLPGADEESLGRFLLAVEPAGSFTESAVRDLYRQASPEGVSLPDLGWLTGVHPLELWVARYLVEHPEATLSAVVAASAEARQEVYAWLFRTGRRDAQDRRIRSLLEVEAFLEIQRGWRRLGYPFDNLVPSYATAIGSSGDRPAALAELVGIILNDGVRHPLVRVEELHFAQGTPYETLLRRRPEEPVQVLSPEVAHTVKRALVDVVQEGTARRARGAFHAADGAELVIGGKTGTGENRFQVFGSGGRVLQSRTVNRTSTLAFFVGDRFFGVVTAYVDGPEAASYRFTSSLPSQVLRQLGPALTPLLQRDAEAPPITP